ncbi:polysaccharide deacetylase family protein [Streptomyces tateyamensis]|uniref:Polysaccharide deacetylase family protein n=1 Tax=Streptomyces tateyamensis TaxID=565073 RepID=A0A2V4PP88_9ACTN|nr:polysaccharide deacetylase family protein [Streptomyces tateyamensis]PYC88126.1 polysaccharide deacetylase family protein [Streptomyces tateyamensis]
MSIPGTRRTLRRALGGGAAVLSLALACACGAAQGAQPQALGSPSPAGGTSAGATPSTTPSTAASPTPSTPASAAPGSATSGAAAPSTARPSGPAGSTATPTPAPGRTPSGGGTTAAAPLPAPDAPGTSIVYSTATGGRTVALTFDDGPGPATGQVLDLLARYGAKATFCEIGPQASANPALVQRIRAEGHRLCDHTVHHPQPMHTLPHDRQVYEITAAKDMIVQAGGPGTQVSWFRAPGGDFSADNRQIAADAGLRPLGWTVDTRDWAKPGVDKIVSTAQRELHPGGIILMHDGGGDRSQTVAALAQLLPWLVQQGYTFAFPAV